MPTQGSSSALRRGYLRLQNPAAILQIAVATQDSALALATALSLVHAGHSFPALDHPYKLRLVVQPNRHFRTSSTEGDPQNRWSPWYSSPQRGHRWSGITMSQQIP